MEQDAIGHGVILSPDRFMVRSLMVHVGFRRQFRPKPPQCPTGRAPASAPGASARGIMVLKRGAYFLGEPPFFGFFRAGGVFRG